MWSARYASDGEVAGFTPVLGVNTVVPLGKVLYAKFPGSVVTGELFYIEVRHVQQSGQKVVPGSPKVALGNACCSILNVWRCTMSQEDK